MTIWKRMLVFCVLASLVMAWVPVSASAVDPVSATTIANAFAQAISAYGAAHGVSMSFDVTNTDGIGENVHELWESFLDDLAEDDDENLQDYESLPVTIIYTLFKKSSGSGGNNNNDDDDDKVAVAISAATAAAFDKFWNWLLSGPAEMQKVDDQYYEWSFVDGSVSPIPVVSIFDPSISGYSLVSLPIYRGSDDGSLSNTYTASENSVYCLPLYNSSNNYKYMVMINLTNQNFQYYPNPNANPSWASLNSGWYYVSVAASTGMYFDYDGTYYPTINSSTVPSTYFGTYDSNNITIDESGINIRPYIGDPVVQPITIPNPEDPEYVPAPVEIPLNIPWDPALFGDGDQDQDSNQVTATAASVGTAILANPENALELEPADEPSNPGDPPGEVYIPFLPVTLPSFNFNFSGIWHYVVSWIGSLGAWFSMVLTVWANLPYAMTVPVYACLVILIVLGVYRRFLS